MDNQNKPKRAKLSKLSYVEYKSLPAGEAILYNIIHFLISIPKFFAKIGVSIGQGLKKAGIAIVKELKSLVTDFATGSWRTKLSYLIMGMGNFTHGQPLRGGLFLGFEAVFAWYMATIGWKWLDKIDNLGDVGSHSEFDPVLDVPVLVAGDNSFDILLYGGLTIVFCLVFIFVWRMNIKQSVENDAIVAAGKKPMTTKQDFHELVDAKFHKTLLAVPITGITLFTALPIVFMIAVAFTNYSASYDGYNNLFTWVGWKNFAELFNSKSTLGYAFGQILGWTLIWAFFATFSNYFLGMILAIMINKKGIRFKKFWRSLFVMTIAVPQFISLLYMSKLFAKNGMINAVLMNLGWIDEYFDFWANTVSARILVIVINIWVGIPYLMLMVTGILMNIPEDLYESARIDGANPFQQFMKITLPYMLFITGPYLLTSFIGNINNFNVIFLLTGSTPANPALRVMSPDGKPVSATDVDLLITWLYKITTGGADGDSQYYLASVIGIMIFIVVSVLSLIAYNLMPSNKNEEDFQ